MDTFGPTTAALKRALLTLPELAVIYWPGGVGRRLRALYYGQRLGHMGRNCIIDVGVVIQGPEHIFLDDDVWLDNYVTLVAGPLPEGTRSTRHIKNAAYAGGLGQIHIGARTHIAPYTLIQGHGGVSIGRDSTVAAHCCVYSYAHHYWGPGVEANPESYHSVPKFSGLAPADEQCMVVGPIAIEEATVVEPNSVVLAGSRIGRFSVIACNSVVQGRVPAGVIAGGSPLTVKKQRFGRPI